MTAAKRLPDCLFRSLLVLVMFGLLACETTDTAMRDSGKSEAYITGFHDGRHSGMKEAGNYFEHMVKDSERFDSDAEYRAGWLAGEQEGIRIQRQADAAVGTGAGYKTVHDAEKAQKHDIEKAAKEATKGVDTESLKTLK